MKKIFTVLFSVIMMFNLIAPTFATEASPQGIEDNSVIITDEDIANADVLIESFTRYDTYPSSNTNLPYTAIAEIYSFVYTNYKFKPSNIGKIHTTFNGSSSSSVTVDIQLYDADATGGPKQVASYSLGSATGWQSQGISWYNLNKDHYYFFKVVKSGGRAQLTFTLKCIAQDW